jgi:hypothetical protein
MKDSILGQKFAIQIVFCDSDNDLSTSAKSKMSHVRVPQR